MFLADSPQTDSPKTDDLWAGMSKRRPPIDDELLKTVDGRDDHHQTIQPSKMKWTTTFI